MVVGGSSQEKENRSPGPNVTVKLFPYGRVPVRARSRRAEHGDGPSAACTAPSRGQPRDHRHPLTCCHPCGGGCGARALLGPQGARPCPPLCQRTLPSEYSRDPNRTAWSPSYPGECIHGAEGPQEEERHPRLLQHWLDSPCLCHQEHAFCPQHSVLPPHAVLHPLQLPGTCPPARADGLVPSETPLRWRPTVTPQPDPSADTADDNELSPSWDKVVVQLFKGNEGQQDSEVTMALPSSTPSPSKAQRAALLLQQLLQMVKDRPDAVAVLMELWGLTAEWGVDPIPQDLLDTHSLSS